MKLNGITDLNEACARVYPYPLVKLDVEAVLGETRVPLKLTKAIMRTDGVEIGRVGPGYEIVQPSTCFDCYKPLQDTGLLEFKNGYQLRDGRGLIIQADVRKSEKPIVKGEFAGLRLGLHNTFDGSGSLGISFQSLVLRCLNGAVGPGEDSVGLRFRHTASIHVKVENAQVQIENFVRAHERNIEAYQAIAAKKADYKTQVKYVHAVFDYKPEHGNNSAQLETKVKRVITLIDNQRDLESVPAMKGTMWQAYNAVTEYLSHEYTKKEEQRVQANWFGAAKELNKKAFQLALNH